MSSESKSRVIYENLDTTFVNLWALLRNLSQREFVGRVRVELQDYTADVFMTGSSTPLVHEIDRAVGTDSLEEAALHRLVLRVRETPGTISVFEGPEEAVAPQSVRSLETKRDHSDLAARTDADDLSVHYTPDAPTESVARVLDAASDEPTLTPEIEGPPIRKPLAPPPSPDANSGAGTPAPISTEVVEAAMPAEPKDEIEWAAVLKTSGELVGGVERALKGAGADFTSLFNAARLELADDYTFLDPMSGEFTYANSVVVLTIEIPAGSYASGLSEALRRVVNGVATGDRARRVRERVAVELFSVVRKRRETLDRSGFLSQLDRIAGTKVL
ncbi:MAG: hypothetical protein QOH70_635 [Blastocatellia bacterium]|jgi:hypothetical protein|nr:hypothetical protein [Blastocatellia bacterium]